MRAFIGRLHVDTAILAALVVALIALHVYTPADQTIERLAGEGFAALLAFLTRSSIRPKGGPNVGSLS